MKILLANWPIGVALTLCFALSTNAEEAEPSADSSRAPLFADHTPLEVTIEAPITTLIRERPEKEYLEGKFSYRKDDGTEQTLDLKFRARGNFRLQKATCIFPPIRLNFRKKQVKDTLFDGQDKLKLVTHCQQNKPASEQLMLREYLAYRILQLLTEKSFSVRLLHIDYVDTDGKNSRVKYAFVIEDDDSVAERNGMKAIKRGNFKHTDLDPVDTNLVNVFMYLIGNTDFSLVQGPPDDDCCHNSGLMSATDGPPYTPLPYDFDFSGLVNAPYAAANPRFHLRSVRSRLYRGRCANNYLLPQTLQKILDNKDAIYALVDELEMFSGNSRRLTIRYFDSFFYAITNPDTIQLEFLEQCVGASQDVTS